MLIGLLEGALVIVEAMSSLTPKSASSTNVTKKFSIRTVLKTIIKRGSNDSISKKGTGIFVDIF